MTRERALSNAVQGEFRLSEFEGIAAHKTSREMFPGEEPNCEVVGLMATLPQGDASGPDFEQEAYVTLGIKYGCFE